VGQVGPNMGVGGCCLSLQTWRIWWRETRNKLAVIWYVKQQPSAVIEVWVAGWQCGYQFARMVRWSRNE
jgi:hypothetical protein